MSHLRVPVITIGEACGDLLTNLFVNRTLSIPFCTDDLQRILPNILKAGYSISHNVTALQGEKRAAHLSCNTQLDVLFGFNQTVSHSYDINFAVMRNITRGQCQESNTALWAGLGTAVAGGIFLALIVCSYRAGQRKSNKPTQSGKRPLLNNGQRH